MNLLVPGDYPQPDAQTEGERRSNADEREQPHDGQRNQRCSDRALRTVNRQALAPARCRLSA